MSNPVSSEIIMSCGEKNCEIPKALILLARKHPQKNVITRAVGSEPIVLMDTFETKLKENDVVLICSDGLHTMVSEKKISEILEKAIENTAEELINLANESGGKDNITVITVKFSDEVK